MQVNEDDGTYEIWFPNGQQRRLQPTIRCLMQLSFEQTLIEVWRQTLVENAKSVKLGADSFPVRRTPKRGLRQVDFTLEGNEIRGLEQNPQTKSRWAEMARSGKKVMQFLSEGRYVANVVDGKITLYGGRAGEKSLSQGSVD